MACALPCCTTQFFSSPTTPRPRTPGPRTVVPYGPGGPVVVPVRPTRAEFEMAGNMRTMGYQMQAYGDAMRASSAAEAANRQIAAQRAAAASYPAWGPIYGAPPVPVPVPVPVAVPVAVPYYTPYPTPSPYPTQTPYGPPPPPAPPPYPRQRSSTPGPRPRYYNTPPPPRHYDPPPLPPSRPPSRPPSYRRGSFYPYPTHTQEVLDDPVSSSHRIDYNRRPKQPRYHGAFYPDHLSYPELPRIEPNYARRRTFSEGMFEDGMYSDGVVHLDIDPPRPRSRGSSLFYHGETSERYVFHDGGGYGIVLMGCCSDHVRVYIRPRSRSRSRGPGY